MDGIVTMVSERKPIEGRTKREWRKPVAHRLALALTASGGTPPADNGFGS
jgi:hypothetical protein